MSHSARAVAWRVCGSLSVPGALDIRSAIRRFEASMESGQWRARARFPGVLIAGGLRADMDWTARRGHARRSSNARASHHRRK